MKAHATTPWARTHVLNWNIGRKPAEVKPMPRGQARAALQRMPECDVRVFWSAGVLTGDLQGWRLVPPLALRRRMTVGKHGTVFVPRVCCASNGSAAESGPSAHRAPEYGPSTLPQPALWPLRVANSILNPAGCEKMFRNTVIPSAARNLVVQIKNLRNSSSPSTPRNDRLDEYFRGLPPPTAKTSGVAPISNQGKDLH